jgi:hypothetical protein|tara:strand:- start:4423 stop:4656 length:234 start_codon:yes stop_codon:yes gene_type:complete
MKNISEHMANINSPSTNYIRNLSQGQVVDKNRYNMQQKMQDQFKKSKKLVYNYNNENKFDIQNDISNYASKGFYNGS